MDNTFRDPKIRGCGRGDIKFMLESGDMGGKCADLNALYVGLARSVGLPARHVYGLRIAKSDLGYKSLGLATDKATHKLAYHLVRIRAMPQLAELAAWIVEQPVRQVPVVRRHGRLRADLPFRTNSPVPIPSSVFRPHWRDLDPYMQVDDIEWEDGRLVVTGRANVPSVDIPRRRNTSKIAVLRPPGRRLPVVLPVRSFLHPEATALSEQDRYNYDWSGFRFAVSPRRLRGTGEWQCYMLVRGHGVWRPARVHTPVPGPAERPRPRQVAPGLRFGARWAGLGLNLAVWRLGAMVAAVDWQDTGPRAVRIDVETARSTGWRGPVRLGHPRRGRLHHPRPGRARAGPQPRRGDPVLRC